MAPAVHQISIARTGSASMTCVHRSHAHDALLIPAPTGHVIFTPLQTPGDTRPRCASRSHHTTRVESGRGRDSGEITRRGLDNPQHKTQITPHNMRHALGSAAHDASRLGGATACTQDTDGCRHANAWSGNKFSTIGQLTIRLALSLCSRSSRRNIRRTCRDLQVDHS